MITGASTARSRGHSDRRAQRRAGQTRRHSYLISMLGIRDVVLAVNKLDMVGYSRAIYDRIEEEYRTFAAGSDLEVGPCIPMSALRGDNVTIPSANTYWYHGPTLMGYWTPWRSRITARDGPFRMLVQWVNHPNHDFRGFSGRVVGGRCTQGIAFALCLRGR